MECCGSASRIWIYACIITTLSAGGLDGYVWITDEWGERSFGPFDVIIGVSKMCNYSLVTVDNVTSTSVKCFDIFDRMPIWVCRAMALETISSLCEGGMLVALFLMVFIFRMEAAKTAAVIASLLPLGLVAAICGGAACILMWLELDDLGFELMLCIYIDAGVVFLTMLTCIFVILNSRHCCLAT